MDWLKTAAEAVAVLSFVGSATVFVVKFILEFKKQRDGQKCLLRAEMLKIYYRYKDQKEIRQYELQKLIDIVNARKVIDSFADRENVCAHLAHWMTKFVVKTSGDYDFYADSLNKAFRTYAIQNDKGEFVIPEGAINEFNAEVQKLNETEAEDPGIRFSLSELSSELKLSMKQIYPLLDFIDEDK